jgi:hypothetical protein
MLITNAITAGKSHLQGGKIMNVRTAAGVLFWAIAAIAVMLSVGDALAEQAGTFTGTWVASGKRQPFDFVDDREVSTFQLAGNVSLKDSFGGVEDFWAECIGLSDSEAGSTVRCVWRSLKGQKAYSVLKGRTLEEGVQVNGEFVGGTGSLKGLAGLFTFTWTSTFIDPVQGMFTGHTEDLSGTYRIP